MPYIPVSDARNLFTKKLIAVYKEQVRVTTFLRSFFVVEETMTKEVSIEVVRGFEKIAVDVIRGTVGNRNTFSLTTEKIFIPPLYWETLNANDHRLYDVAIGMGSDIAFAALAKELGVDLFKMQQKIERAIEKQCADVLESGIISLQNGTNIDFKRKAEHLKDGSATPWDNNAYSPFDQIEEGCRLIRENGKSQGIVYNLILGSLSKRAFDNNTKVTSKGAYTKIDWGTLRQPQQNQVGGVSHGYVSCGDYVVNLWTYPEVYTNAEGVATPYVNPKKIILLPESPNFKLAFAAVPQLIGKDGSVPQQGAFLVTEHIDEKAVSHEFAIKSAPVAIPVAVDQIYTRLVLS